MTFWFLKKTRERLSKESSAIFYCFFFINKVTKEGSELFPPTDLRNYCIKFKESALGTTYLFSIVYFQQPNP